MNAPQDTRNRNDNQIAPIIEPWYTIHAKIDTVAMIVTLNAKMVRRSKMGRQASPVAAGVACIIGSPMRKENWIVAANGCLIPAIDGSFQPPGSTPRRRTRAAVQTARHRRRGIRSIHSKRSSETNSTLTILVERRSNGQLRKTPLRQVWRSGHRSSARSVLVRDPDIRQARGTRDQDAGIAFPPGAVYRSGR